jgi:predicted Zn-dependent peptidase
MVRLAQGEINFGRYIPLEEVVDHIERVTAEEIQTLAGTLFQDDKLVLTVLGPLSGVGPFQDAIRMI